MNPRPQPTPHHGLGQGGQNPRPSQRKYLTRLWMTSQPLGAQVPPAVCSLCDLRVHDMKIPNIRHQPQARRGVGDLAATFPSPCHFGRSWPAVLQMALFLPPTLCPPGPETLAFPITPLPAILLDVYGAEDARRGDLSRSMFRCARPSGRWVWRCRPAGPRDTRPRPPTPPHFPPYQQHWNTSCECRGGYAKSLTGQPWGPGPRCGGRGRERNLENDGIVRGIDLVCPSTYPHTPTLGGRGRSQSICPLVMRSGAY